MNFDELKNGILNCRDCSTKFGFKPVPIFRGNANSKIFQISQAPSNKVQETGKPFSDQSGKKLKYEWYKITDEIFYNEENFYITALSHCFPGKNKSGGDKLPPAACSKKWLQKEIEVVDNKIFVIIGSKASGFLFPHEDFNDLVFKDNYINKKLTLVLPHPSPLNIKWFKDHPDFETKRLPLIRKVILDTLNLNLK